MADDPKPLTQIDPQDPLPEAGWLWRRVFVYAVTAAILFILYGSVDRLGTVAVVRPDIGIKAFVSIVKLLVITLNVMALFYLAGASAEQITKLVKTASLLKSGVQIASRAVSRKPDHTEERVATIGQPPQPVAPPALAEPEVTSDEDFAPRSRT